MLCNRRWLIDVYFKALHRLPVSEKAVSVGSRLILRSIGSFPRPIVRTVYNQLWDGKTDVEDIEDDNDDHFAHQSAVGPYFASASGKDCQFFRRVTVGNCVPEKSDRRHSIVDQFITILNDFTNRTSAQRSASDTSSDIKRLITDCDRESLFALLIYLSSSTLLAQTLGEAIRIGINESVVSRFSSEKFELLVSDRLMMILKTLLQLFVPLKRPEHLRVVHRLLTAIAERCHRLSDDQLTFFLLGVGFYRYMPQPIAAITSSIENQLIKRFSWLTDSQLGMAGFAYYRTSTSFNGRRILDLMVRRIFVLSASTPDQISVVPLKLLKQNGKPEHRGLLRFVIHRMLNEPLETYPFYHWSHLASACRLMDYYDKRFAEKMIKKMQIDFHQLRLKDLSLMLSYLCYMNHQLEPSLLHDAVNHLRRAPEYGWQHMTVRVLFALSLQATYPEDLINRVLSPEFITNFLELRRSMEGLPVRALYWLDCCVGIECPNYTGHRLHLSLFDKPEIKALKQNPDSDMSHSASLLVLRQMIQLALNCSRDAIFVGLALPHSPMPCVLVKLIHGKVVPLTSSHSQARNIRFEDLVLPQGEKRVAFLLQNRGSCRHKTLKFLGHHFAHRRQLQKLGYNIVLVSQTMVPTVPTTFGVTKLQTLFQLIRSEPQPIELVY